MIFDDKLRSFIFDIHFLQLIKNRKIHILLFVLNLGLLCKNKDFT